MDLLPKRARVCRTHHLTGGEATCQVVGGSSGQHDTAGQWVYAGGMLEMAFACLAGTEAEARHSLLLAQSLRAFGGSLAGAPVMALYPLGGAPPPELEPEMRAAAITPVPFALPAPLSDVPLAQRAAGAAQAEAVAQETARLLVWLDSDTLILREPLGLKIPQGALVGCRPVDLRLIGSAWDEAPDPLWASIYAGCGVDAERIFPVRTTIEGQALRAYFNAGCLVTRPEARILRRWLAGILSLAGRDAFRSLSGRERLFFHQAVLAGTLLATLRREEIAILPATVNYPLHLHDRVPGDRRPAGLSQIESCRYEGVFDREDWASRVPVEADLQEWLEARRWLARNA